MADFIRNFVHTKYPETIEALTRLWEASVRQSHHFLTEKDIQALKPYAKAGLESIENLFVSYEQNEATGFIGIEKDKIEMLFISPEYFGKGIGKLLLTMACEKFGVRYVDVNEQNHKAEGFYRHLGFQTFERTETILKMKRVPLPPPTYQIERETK